MEKRFKSHKKWILLCAVWFLAMHTVRPAEIRVSAAASLKNALNEVAEVYQGRSGHRLILNFDSSGTLARQIQEGAPVDVFVSADAAKMDFLSEKNLILRSTRRDILGNQLAIVVAGDCAAVIQTPADLAASGIRKVAVGQPQAVPAGIYARAYLEGLGLWDRVSKKILPCENVRSVLAAVEAGHADAGIVYVTDALISKKVRTAVVVGVEQGPRIVYPAAVTKASGCRREAEDFVGFLQGADARRIFRKFGFAVLSD
ncbi:MAG: molybdate ABC transporter substrate-binding protein [Verrucomicrobiae bacterium]|nr:molybdate ABC transporter substrate-binding protein [Verrucomicrobiae bacterium]